MNLSELAEKLGISVATVCRVLQGKGEASRISLKTRQRIEAAALEFGVAPDSMASGLRTGKSGIVGLLVPDITNPFFSGLARAIELNLRERGMALMLSDSNENEATELELIMAMKSRRMDGLILALVGVESTRLENLILGAKQRIIVVDRFLPALNEKVSTVTLDNFLAGKMAAEHLIAAGHRKIGCLRGNPDSHADVARLRGVTAAMAEMKLVPKVAGSGYSSAEGLKGARELLEGDCPSAVVSLTGQGVLGLLQVSREMGINIPGNLSLVGFDEQRWADFLEAPLTTVVQPVAEMARRAVALLLDSEEVVFDALNAHVEVRKSVKSLDPAVRRKQD